MFNEKINYCINRLTESIEDSVNEARKLGILLEEAYVFDINKNKGSYEENFYNIAYNKNYIQSKFTFKKIILREIKNIKTFKYADGIIERFLSPYGSLYYGDGVLYYNDNLASYNNEQFYQIILNHIFHYSLGMLFTNTIRITKNKIDLNKSKILLGFHHLGIIKQPLPYSISKRNKIYDNLGQAVNDYIVFNVASDNMVYNFLSKYVDLNKTNFFIKNKLNSIYLDHEKKFKYDEIHIAQYAVYINKHNGGMDQKINLDYMNECDIEIEKIIKNNLSF